jgi:hypothetical protein
MESSYENGGLAFSQKTAQEKHGGKHAKISKSSLKAEATSLSSVFHRSRKSLSVSETRVLLQRESSAIAVRR